MLDLEASQMAWWQRIHLVDAGDTGLFLVRKILGRANGKPLQYSLWTQRSHNPRGLSWDTTEHAHAQVRCASWQKFHVIHFYGFVFILIQFKIVSISLINLLSPHGLFKHNFTYAYFSQSALCSPHHTAKYLTPLCCEPTVRNIGEPKFTKLSNS